MASDFDFIFNKDENTNTADCFPVPEPEDVIDLLLHIVVNHITFSGIASRATDTSDTFPFIAAPCSSDIAVAIYMLHKLDKLKIVTEHHSIMGICCVVAKINPPDQSPSEDVSDKIAPEIMKGLEGLLANKDRNRFKD